jgi:predicted house-cleaning noncanonical NTP pyrophosphatase (MazG superfamily)
MEVLEYSENNCIEELCDILEVLEAISKAMKFSDEDIRKIKEERCRKNGAFKNKLLLQKIIVNLAPFITMTIRIL